MLWRVRTSMADRPGALAALAARCGEENVNILGLQIFPGIDTVTDELVLSSPDGWVGDRVAAMVQRAGGTHVAVSEATGYALVDGPTNYLLGARHAVETPADLQQTLSELLDADTSGSTDPGLAILELTFRDARIAVRRKAPFTVTEQARAEAFVSLVSDLTPESPVAETEDIGRLLVLPTAGVDPDFRLATATDVPAFVRMIARCSAGSLSDRFGSAITGMAETEARDVLLGGGSALVARVGTEIVGIANVSNDDPADAVLLVEDAWQGRGIATRLLGLAARLAKSRGATELVLQSRYNAAAIPRLSAASGLHGRVRHHDGAVILTASLRRVTPLDGGADPALGSSGLTSA